MKRRLLSTLLTLVSLSSAGVLADARDHYREGMRAFKAGEYTRALNNFRAAADAGLGTPTLRYNIGVVHYKLGELSEARASFATLTQDPKWGAIAHYNLGLIADKQGSEGVARDHYRTAIAQTDSEKIRRLANAKLNENVEILKVAGGREQWRPYASLAAGFDDNVTLTDEISVDAVSDQEDYFVEAVGFAARYLSGDISDGWRLDLGGYYRANADLDDFDVGSALIGATYNRIIQRWHIQAGLRGDLQTVGGSLFATGVGFKVSAYRGFGNVGLRITDELKYVDGSSDYQYLSGMRNRVKIELTRQIDRARWGISYEHEANDRDDLAFTDEFFSYSPSVHQAVARVDYDFSARLSGEIRLDLRSSSYADENIEVDLDGSVQQAERDETRFSVSVRLSRRLSDAWRVFGEYQHTDNDANFDRYQYVNNRLLFGVELAP